MGIDWRNVVASDIALEEISAARQHISQAFAAHSFKTEEGKRLAQDGLCRRLDTLEQCLQNVSELLPPELDTVPSKQRRSSVVINVQAFTSTLVGSLKNVFCLWSAERGIAMPPINADPSRQLSTLHGTLRRELQRYLDRKKSWLRDVETFHAAMHDPVPLFLPPHLVEPRNFARYREIERGLAEVEDNATFFALKSEERSLLVHRPWLVRDIVGYHQPVVIHGRLLNDFALAIEFTERFLTELEWLADGKRSKRPTSKASRSAGERNLMRARG